MERITDSDFAVVLSPLNGDNPAGENCEYDELYLALDSYALGTPEDEMGDSVIEGKEPDYRALYKTCLTLWEKTRDLRVACFFTLSSVCLFGLKGLKDGLRIVDSLVKEQFDSFYPQPDPDDDNDPTERINILSMLSPVEGAYSDPYKFLSHVREFRLVKELDYTLRDYLVASGYLESEDSYDLSSLNAQLCSVPASSVKEQLGVLDEVITLANSICDTFNEKIGNAGYLSLDSLKHELQVMRNMYANVLKNSVSDVQSDESSASVSSLAPNSSVVGSVAVSGATPPSGSVSMAKPVLNIDDYVPKNRNEAIMLLKKSAEYFTSAEPTSPVPFLINRAVRMANMNFMDLLAEIDQNAVDRGREQLGVKVENNDS
ncbi:MAG: type VI secretion system protein TssA [Succinivibrio sp.]